MAIKFDEDSTEELELSDVRISVPFTLAVDPLSSMLGFKGKIVEAQIFNRILTDEEIKKLARGEKL